MSYRDETEALRARVDVLERELARERGLDHEPPPPGVDWSRVRRSANAVLGLGAGLFGLAVALVMMDLDAPGERLAQASIVVATFGPLLAWGGARREWAGAALAVHKLAWVIGAALYWGYLLPRAERPWEVFRFFWYVPSAMLVHTLLERFLLELEARVEARRSAKPGSTP